jgi:hypothetical protein
LPVGKIDRREKSLCWGTDPKGMEAFHDAVGIDFGLTPTFSHSLQARTPSPCNIQVTQHVKPADVPSVPGGSRLARRLLTIATRPAIAGCDSHHATLLPTS